jgi:hypothetical protein
MKNKWFPQGSKTEHMGMTLVATKSEPKYTRENQVKLTREAGAESFKQENQSDRKTMNW